MNEFLNPFPTTQKYSDLESLTITSRKNISNEKNKKNAFLNGKYIEGEQLNTDVTNELRIQTTQPIKLHIFDTLQIAK